MIENGNIERFNKYSQFQNLKEFNEHMQGWLGEYKDFFTRGELIALYQLTRYCAKVVGVTNAKIGTILKAINEQYNNNGISRSTFKRMVVKARKIGMVKIIHLSQKNGAQSSNLYIFQHYPKLQAKPSSKNELKPDMSTVFKDRSFTLSTDDTPTQITNSSTMVQNEPPNSKKLDHHKTNQYKTKIYTEKKRNHIHFDYTYTAEWVPTRFRNLVKCFYDDAEVIEEYWKMVNIAAYYYLFENENEMKLYYAVRCFKQTMRGVKKNKVRNPIGYFYGMIKRKFQEEFHKMLDFFAEEGV